MAIRAIGLLVAAFLFTSSAQPAGPPQIGDLRERCSRDARDYYERGWNSPIPNYTTGYTNHYNKKLDRCFLLVTAHLQRIDKWTNRPFTSDDKILVDVFENREIGSFSQDSEHLPKPLYCGIGAVYCKSAEEWDALAKPYMEE